MCTVDQCMNQAWWSRIEMLYHATSICDFYMRFLYAISICDFYVRLCSVMEPLCCTNLINIDRNRGIWVMNTVACLRIFRVTDSLTKTAILKWTIQSSWIEKVSSIHTKRWHSTTANSGVCCVFLFGLNGNHFLPYKTWEHTKGNESSL